jgi:hypothetical protein
MAGWALNVEPMLASFAAVSLICTFCDTSADGVEFVAPAEDVLAEVWEEQLVPLVPVATEVALFPK